MCQVNCKRNQTYSVHKVNCLPVCRMSRFIKHIDHFFLLDYMNLMTLPDTATYHNWPIWDFWKKDEVPWAQVILLINSSCERQRDLYQKEYFSEWLAIEMVSSREVWFLEPQPHSKLNEQLLARDWLHFIKTGNNMFIKSLLKVFGLKPIGDREEREYRSKY